MSVYSWGGHGFCWPNTDQDDLCLQRRQASCCSASCTLIRGSQICDEGMRGRLWEVGRHRCKPQAARSHDQSDRTRTVRCRLLLRLRQRVAVLPLFASGASGVAGQGDWRGAGFGWRTLHGVDQRTCKPVAGHDGTRGIHAWSGYAEGSRRGSTCLVGHFGDCDWRSCQGASFEIRPEPDEVRTGVASFARIGGQERRNDRLTADTASRSLTRTFGAADL